MHENDYTAYQVEYIACSKWIQRLRMRWIIIYLNKKLFLSYQELKTSKIDTYENSSQ